MEEKYFVEIKDDFGKTSIFEVPSLEMKIAIDNIDKEIKEQYKQDALRYSTPFSAYGVYAENLGVKLNEEPEECPYIVKLRKQQLFKCLWKVVKKMKDEKYKKILYMRHKGKVKMKFNQIAEILGCLKQSISDNYKVAIADLRVMLNNDKDFKNTYFYKNYRRRAKVQGKLAERDKLKEEPIENNILNVDNMIEVFDLFTETQKKMKKLGLDENPKKTMKEQKFSMLGQEFSFQDVLDVAKEFLKPFRDKNDDKNKKK